LALAYPLWRDQPWACAVAIFAAAQSVMVEWRDRYRQPQGQLGQVGRGADGAGGFIALVLLNTLRRRCRADRRGRSVVCHLEPLQRHGVF